MGWLVFAVVLTMSFSLYAQTGSDRIHHTVVFREQDRFAGWPANHGIWNWGDQIVVGFKLGYYKQNPEGGHAIDGDRPAVPRQARSLDGGETWKIETPDYLDQSGNARSTRKLAEPIDFSNPDLAVKFSGGEFYVSPDRCHSWAGPYALPNYDRPKLLARTDYIVEGKYRLTAFIAADKDDGDEGQPLCIRTTDGGMTWDLVGWIGEQPPTGYGYAIMPATARLGETGYLTIVRRGGIFDGRKRWWLEAFVSPDDGSSWYKLDKPQIDNSGNPATLTRLADGRLALAYGWRKAPSGIRAIISSDDGQTWSREIVLRADAASWDIGYPRTVQRADGKLVTIYYYHDAEQPERYVACTIWDPMRRR